ncbi:unnamed protein product, partial [Prorocentrum cordatum]
MEQMAGGIHRIEQLAVFQLNHRNGFAPCGVEVYWTGAKLHSKHPRVDASNDFAKMMADLISALVLQLVQRAMTTTHGYPKRQVLLLDAGSRRQFLAELRSDIQIYETLKTTVFEGAQGFIGRSLFQHTAVQQMIKCLELEGWAATERTAVAIVLDAEVVQTTHRYTPVVKDEVAAPRDCRFEPNAFKPVMKKSALHGDLLPLNLSAISSHNDADWYSPNAAGHFQPYVDIARCREASRENRLSLLDRRFCSRLITNEMVFRRKGSVSWYWGLGSICGSMAVGWPVGEYGPRRYRVLPDRKRELFAILDLTEWE